MRIQKADGICNCATTSEADNDTSVRQHAVRGGPWRSFGGFDSHESTAQSSSRLMTDPGWPGKRTERCEYSAHDTSRYYRGSDPAFDTDLIPLILKIQSRHTLLFQAHLFCCAEKRLCMPAFFRGLKAGSDGHDADDDAIASGEMTVTTVIIVIRRDH